MQRHTHQSRRHIARVLKALLLFALVTNACINYHGSQIDPITATISNNPFIGASTIAIEIAADQPATLKWLLYDVAAHTAAFPQIDYEFHFDFLHSDEIDTIVAASSATLTIESDIPQQITINNLGAGVTYRFVALLVAEEGMWSLSAEQFTTKMRNISLQDASFDSLSIAVESDDDVQLFWGLYTEGATSGYPATAAELQAHLLNPPAPLVAGSKTGQNDGAVMLMADTPYNTTIGGLTVQSAYRLYALFENQEQGDSYFSPYSSYTTTAAPPPTIFTIYGDASYGTSVALAIEEPYSETKTECSSEATDTTFDVASDATADAPLAHGANGSPHYRFIDIAANTYCFARTTFTLNTPLDARQRILRMAILPIAGGVDTFTLQLTDATNTQSNTVTVTFVAATDAWLALSWDISEFNAIDSAQITSITIRFIYGETSFFGGESAFVLHPQMLAYDELRFENID